MNVTRIFTATIWFSLILVSCVEQTTPIPTSPPTIALPTRTSTSEQVCKVEKGNPVFSAPSGTENITVAEDGTLYATDFCSGKVFAVHSDGISSLVAAMPYGATNTDCQITSTLGVALSRDGHLWVAVGSNNPRYNGVWRVGIDGGTDLVFLMDAATLPNDLIFDGEGTLYLTESIAGAIWRAPSGDKLELWLESDLLKPPPGGQFGANGIAFRNNAIYVANTDAGTIVRIPITPGGSPGEQTIFASGINGPDGMSFDATGNLYVAAAYGDQLVRVTPDGKLDVTLNLGLLGVSYLTDVAVPLGTGDRIPVYVADLKPGTGEASVVKLELCPTSD